MVNVIRAYGTPVQGIVTGHLDLSLKQILGQQPPIRERLKPMDGAAAR
jgi:polyhydroxyalkanoate synthesis regulator protein